MTDTDKGVEEKTVKTYAVYVDAVLDLNGSFTTVESERGVLPDEMQNEEGSYRIKYVARSNGTKEPVYIKKSV